MEESAKLSHDNFPVSALDCEVRVIISGRCCFEGPDRSLGPRNRARIRLRFTISCSRTETKLLGSIGMT